MAGLVRSAASFVLVRSVETLYDEEIGKAFLIANTSESVYPILIQP